jgi:methyl-CpG-binding domain protein 4
MAVILVTMGYCLMANTTPLSDDLMVQQQISGAWQHMVGVIMLNQTGRKPVKTVLPEFLSRWPTPEAYLESDPDEVKSVIRPLGFYNRREQTFRRMSQDFLTWDGEDATKLYGIGQYGSESYRIFFLGERFEPQDKELRRYLGYPQLEKQHETA